MIRGVLGFVVRGKKILRNCVFEKRGAVPQPQTNFLMQLNLSKHTHLQKLVKFEKQNETKFKLSKQILVFVTPQEEFH